MTVAKMYFHFTTPHNNQAILKTYKKAYADLLKLSRGRLFVKYNDPTVA